MPFSRLTHRGEEENHSDYSVDGDSDAENSGSQRLRVGETRNFWDMPYQDFILIS